jgi:hypothetical protein
LPPPPDYILIVGPDDSTCESDPFCEGTAVFSDFFTAVADGVVDFEWRYQTEDASPKFDPAFFVVREIGKGQISLSDKGIVQSGFGAFSVSAGDDYAFFVESIDNAFGGARLEIFNPSFTANDAPGSDNSVPEPTSLTLASVALVALITARKRKQKILTGSKLCCLSKPRRALSRLQRIKPGRLRVIL